MIRTTMTATYPHLVVRFMPTVYQTENVEVRRGAPAVEILHRKSYLQHPQPFNCDGALTPGCRALLINAVQAFSRQRRWCVCVRWTATAATYIDADAITEAIEPC